jgi:MFS family permease
VQYGTATLIAGSLGVLLGPTVARLLLQRHGVDAPVRTTLVAACGIVPLCLFLPFAPNYWSALVASALAGLFVNLTLPVVASAVSESTPNRMRGLVASVYAFVLTSVGIGLAPTLIALGTDHVLRDPAQVGTSLGFVCGLAALASLPVLAGAARRYAARVR